MRADQTRLAGSTISRPAFGRTADPLSSEMVLKAPGLELVAQQIAGSRRSDILDLGSPCRANVDYLSQFPCTLHIGDMARALADDPEMSAPEEERDVEGVIERLISYKDDIHFDAIFVWDLFDYLDVATIRAITRRVGHYCRTGTLLYLTTSNGETIPDEPGRFTLMDEQHFRFERVGTDTRSGMKHSPRGLERIMPGFRLLHSFLLGHQMQDYLFIHD